MLNWSIIFLNSINRRMKTGRIKIRNLPYKTRVSFSIVHGQQFINLLLRRNLTTCFFVFLSCKKITQKLKTNLQKLAQICFKEDSFESTTRSCYQYQNAFCLHIYSIFIAIKDHIFWTAYVRIRIYLLTSILNSETTYLINLNNWLHASQIIYTEMSKCVLYNQQRELTRDYESGQKNQS